LTYGKTEV
jgi:hypothetical protein